MNARAWSRTTAASLLAFALLAFPPAARPARAGEIAIEGLAGSFQMAASNTGSAVFGSDSGATFGGALRFTLARGVFVEGGVRTFSKSGERVFVATPSSVVQKLGFPLSMRLTPIFLDVGYRFRQGRLVVPYLAVGGTLTQYDQTSNVAGQSFDESTSKAGFLAAGGVEIGRGLLRLAAEGGWTTTPNAIGIADVSQVYGEKDIGGKYVIAKLVLVFPIR